MKLVFVSNALDHIQSPLCDALRKETNGQFYYVATSKSSAIRSNITALDINKSRDYVIRPYESDEEKAFAQEVVNQADVVILGTATERYIVNRIKQGKLTFRYMERLYKTPFTVGNIFRRAVSAYIHHSKYQKYPLYMLCAGAYAAYDHSVFKNYTNKSYKWGYFPALIENNIDILLDKKSNNSVAELTWVGRFVSLKHPEQVINLAKYLKEKGYQFHISMIGYGELEPFCREQVKISELSNYIDILGAKSPQKVREYMDRTDILLFTSDRQEGWGAVVNEGMNSGCAVVASSSAGVSPFLVNDGENGLLYDCSSQDSLNRKVEKLILDKDVRENMARKGYETVQKYWNPENAARSFVVLAQSILKNQEIKIQVGPCSKAPIWKDGWFKDNE